MISYKIKDKTSPIIHEIRYPISKKEVQRVRLLLNLSFNEMGDSALEALGIRPDSSECIIGVSFNDGATLDWNLCCGEGNYYDEITFQYPDKTKETLDSSYQLDDIEIDAGTDIYIVRLDIQDE